MPQGFDVVFAVNEKGKGRLEVVVPAGEPLDRHPWLKIANASGASIEVPIQARTLLVAAQALHAWEVQQTNA